LADPCPQGSSEGRAPTADTEGEIHAAIAVSTPLVRSRQAPEDPAARLLRAVAERRDVSAFSDLFDRYAPRLHRYLLAFAKEQGQAEELVQEIMLSIWLHASSYDPSRASVDAWVFRIARNRRIDTLRRERRPRPEPVRAHASQPSAESEAADAERSLGVRRAIAGLPEPQAEILRRMYFRDESIADIASATGLPVGTIKSRVRLAMNRLRAMLGGESR